MVYVPPAHPLLITAILHLRMWLYELGNELLTMKGFSTQQSNPNANVFAMYPNYLARGYQGLHVKQANRKKN